MSLHILWHHGFHAILCILCQAEIPTLASVLWQSGSHALSMLHGRLYVTWNSSCSMTMLDILWHDLVPEVAMTVLRRPRWL